MGKTLRARFSAMVGIAATSDLVATVETSMAIDSACYCKYRFNMKMVDRKRLVQMSSGKLRLVRF
jgi:hypothetical protein